MHINTARASNWSKSTPSIAATVLCTVQHPPPPQNIFGKNGVPGALGCYPSSAQKQKGHQHLKCAFWGGCSRAIIHSLPSLLISGLGSRATASPGAVSSAIRPVCHWVSIEKHQRLSVAQPRVALSQMNSIWRFYIWLWFQCSCIVHSWWRIALDIAVMLWAAAYLRRGK